MFLRKLSSKKILTISGIKTFIPCSHLKMCKAFLQSPSMVDFPFTMLHHTELTNDGNTDLVTNILDIVEMLGWFILWRTVAAFDDATFGYVLHCFKHFLDDICYKCLVVFLFIVVRHIRVVTFFPVKFYHARNYGHGFMTPMQSLWLEFYWKFKAFTEINVNKETTKHSSD